VRDIQNFEIGDHDDSLRFVASFDTLEVIMYSMLALLLLSITGALLSVDDR